MKRRKTSLQFTIGSTTRTCSNRQKNGAPKMCWECHDGPPPSSAFVKKDKGMHLSLSAAIHGFHANYLTGKDGDACNACHSSSPDRYTRCFRGIHVEMGMDCTSCHGKMEDHALSLLTSENDKPSAQRLMDHLSPRSVSEKPASSRENHG